MIGAQTAMSLDDATDEVAKLQKAISSISAEAIVLCHGGPIAGPEEARHVISTVPGVHGFLGASSMERVPTETAMVDHMRSYSEISLAP